MLRSSNSLRTRLQIANRALVIIFLASPCLVTATPASQEHALQTLQCVEPIRFHVLRLSDSDEPNSITELMVEVVERVGSATGRAFSLHRWNYPRTVEAIRDGSAHVAVAAERLAESFDPNGLNVPILRLQLVILRKTNEWDRTGGRGGILRIGTMRGSPHIPRFDTGFGYRLIEIHDVDAGYKMLESDRLEGLLVMRPVADDLVRRNSRERRQTSEITWIPVEWQNLVVHISSKLPEPCKSELKAIADAQGKGAARDSFLRIYPSMNLEDFSPVQE